MLFLSGITLVLDFKEKNYLNFTKKLNVQIFYFLTENENYEYMCYSDENK